MCTFEDDIANALMRVAVDSRDSIASPRDVEGGASKASAVSTSAVPFVGEGDEAVLEEGARPPLDPPRHNKAKRRYPGPGMLRMRTGS